MKLKVLYQRWQERRRQRVADEYGSLSDAERADVERLREEHSPLGDPSRPRTPPPFRGDQP